MLLFLIGALILAALSYWLGFFDWPKFVLRAHLLESKKELYAVVATSRDKNYPSVIPRLLEGTKKGILNADKSSAKLLAGAASLYGAPEGAECLSVGLYLDKPNVESPRWAIGWAVATTTFEKAQELASRVKDSNIQEPVRAVRVGPGPILTARIPWRNMLTPMMAPMLHWQRGFDEFKQKFQAEEDEAVACEIYVTGPNDSMEYIDYVVLMGDETKNKILKDTFPDDEK